MKRKAIFRAASEEANAPLGAIRVVDRLLAAVACRQAPEPMGPVQLQSTKHDFGYEVIRATLAAVLKVSRSTMSSLVASQHVQQIQDDAADEAILVPLYLNQMSLQLARLGCINLEDIKDYLDAEERVLIELYAELTRPRPSPTRLLQFGVRFALDARKTIDAPIHRIEIRPIEAGYEVAVLPSGQNKISSLPYPAQPIGNPFASVLLSLIQRKPPAYSEIMELIETLLPHVISSPESAVSEESKPLLVIESHASIVLVAGRPFVLSDEACRFVKLLHSEPNVWFGPDDYERDAVLRLTRVPRVYAGLPAPIRKLIEGRRGTGYRLSKKRLAELGHKTCLAKPCRNHDNVG